jgi:hypothetical protein
MPRPPRPLPPLQPVQEIARPLTGPEYFHACIGSHRQTVITPREVVLILEGRCDDISIDWQAAFDRVVAANPGCRLRLTGHRRRARWSSDGTPLPVRRIETLTWDGRSDVGSEFIQAQPLSLTEGRSCELIVAGSGARCMLVFRAHHAIMDGMGITHVAQELFRHLRGEPLLGSNASYTDVDLMRSLPCRLKFARKPRPAFLTGGAQGEQPGGLWRRITLPGPQPNLMQRVAVAITEHARQHSSAPVRLALPINLRRHAPELQATTNFTNMLYLDITAQDDPECFKQRLTEALADNADANYPGIIEWIRCLPFPWLDRMLSPNQSNFRQPKNVETAVLTVMGPFKRSAFSGGGFHATALYGLPQKESAFIVIVGMQGSFEILVGMANVFASQGRFDAFIADLQQRLAR